MSYSLYITSAAQKDCPASEVNNTKKQHDTKIQ